MSFRNSPSCNCCATGCEILSTIARATPRGWITLSGVWDEDGEVLAGANALAVTMQTLSGPQCARAAVTAHAPGQVLGIILGCDAVGAPGLMALLTFGDSSVLNGSGTIQLFENGNAITGSANVLGLVDGSEAIVTISSDAAIAVAALQVRTEDDDVRVEGVPLADPGGRLGLLLLVDQSESIDVEITHWDRTQSSLSGWTTLAGTWVAPDGELTGATAKAITVSTESGAQFFSANIEANEPGQVFDIMLGCDETGEPDVFVRITFGDKAIPGSCGSIQLFEAGAALEDPSPIMGLVHGTRYGFSMCCDAVLSRMVVTFNDAYDGNTLGFRTVTAALASDPDGRLGIRMVDARNGTVFIRPSRWSHVFVSGQETCQSCAACGTLIGAQFVPTGSDANCEFTVSGVNRSTIDSHQIISAFDRQQGYGVDFSAGVAQSEQSSKFIEASIDNGHHVARLTFGVWVGNSSGYSTSLLLEIKKDGVLVAGATGTTGSRFYNFFGIGVEMEVGFCDGAVFAHAQVWPSSLGSGPTDISAGGLSDQVGDGSDHGVVADVPYGRINNFQTVRCLNCEHCEVCGDVDAETRNWQIEIAAVPATHDGTYVVAMEPGECAAMVMFTELDAGLTQSLWLSVRRHDMLVGARVGTRITNRSLFDGTTSGPITDCENVVDEVINITGDVTIGVYVVTIQEGSGAQNEIVTVTLQSTPPPAATGFRLTHAGNTTALILPGDDEVVVQAALEALPSIGIGNVLVTGVADGPWTIEFIGALALTDVSAITSAGLPSPFTGTATVTHL